MSEDVKPVEPGQPPVTPDPVTTQEPAAPEPNVVEEKARGQGWVPKEDWTGDPAAWRPADVYLDRGELLGKIKSQSSELRELKGMIGYVSEQNRKLYEAGYAKAIADLESARDHAVQEGDHKAVRELDREIRAHEKALEDTRKPVQVPTDPQGLAQEAQERYDSFRSANPWYDADEVMQDWANGAAVKFKAKNPNAKDLEIYAHLHKEVQTKFPDKFKQRVGAPSPGGAGTRGTGSPVQKGGSEFDSLLAELPEAEAQIARNLVKRGHVTKEQFMESYKQLGSRR